MLRLEPGSVVHGLRVEREIGRGAFGTVYLAEDELLGRRVALKVVSTANTALRDRGLREARVVARVKSPFIVTLYRVHALAGEAGWLLEMEYVGGGSLKEVLEHDGRVPVPRAVEIITGVLEALRVAHGAGIVHGDVKPGNVLLEPSGAVKLADFGLSWLIDDASLSSLGDGPVGTPAYMAPEVVLGESNRAASDLWSAGTVFYQMLAGRTPFATSHLQQLFLSVLNADPPPLASDVPPGVRRLVAGLLAKDPADRPDPATALAALARAMDAEPAPAAEAAPTLPVVRGLLGRERETATLAGVLDQLAAGEGGSLLVTGDAGAGKSALLRWMCAEAERRGMAVAEVTVTALEGVLGPLLRGARRVASPGLDVPGLPESTARRLLHGEGDEDLGSRQQIAWAVAQLFAAIARDRPLVVAIENAQDADAEDVHLLRELLRQLPARGVVTAVAFRTHEPDSSAAGRTAARLHELASLEGLQSVEAVPLAPHAIHALLQRTTHASYIDPAVAQRLVALAEGNPLLATEMMRHFEAAGSVIADGSSIRSAGAFESASLPTRFHELVELRVAGLSEAQRALLDAAAVDGRAFDGEALEAVLGRPLLEILRDLQRIYRERHLVEPHGEGYRFTSAVVQEVLYEGIAPALRRAIHQRLAQHLEARKAPVDPVRLGVHWERAGETERAVPHLMRAAAEAARRQEKLRLIDLCERAGMRPGQVTREAVRAYLDTLLRLAAAYREHGHTEAMDRLYDDLLAKVDVEDAALRVQVRRALAHYYTRGVASVDRAVLARAIRALPGSRESGDAQVLEGLIAKVEGRLADAEASFRAAERDFLAVGDTGAHITCINQIASVALRSERFDEAERLYAEVARLARETGRPINAAIGDLNRALAALQRGSLDGLLAAVEEAVRTLMMAGSGPVPGATIILAQVLYAHGQLSEAFSRVQTAVDLLRQYTDVISIESVRTEEAHLAAVQGMLPRAREALRAARAAAEKGGHLTGQVTIASLEAQVGCMEGDVEAARAAAARAVALAAGAEEAGTRFEPDHWLAEAVLYGLPGESLPSSASEFVAAARALATPGGGIRPPERLPGRRRQTLHLVRDLYAAEAHRRAGDPGTGAALAREVADRARRLGHVWLELAALKGLAPADDGARRRHGELLARVAAQVPDGPARERLLAAWR